MSATAPPRTGNEIGRMTGLTLLTPVRPSWLLFLRLGFFVSWHAKVFNRHILQFAYVIPKDIRLTWGRGINFPHPPPSEPLKAWIARNSMEGGTYYCAYPKASTRMVRSALNVRERFLPLARDAERMSPEEFAAAYERFLVEAQADL